MKTHARHGETPGRTCNVETWRMDYVGGLESPPREGGRRRHSGPALPGQSFWCPLRMTLTRRKPELRRTLQRLRTPTTPFSNLQKMQIAPTLAIPSPMSGST